MEQQTQTLAERSSSSSYKFSNRRDNILFRDPSFITQDLILSTLKRDKLHCGGKAKDTLRDPDQINPRKAKVLLIEYKTISKITNISHMINLRVLKLPNNLIEQIEGIEELINLEELDLSFNQIHQIQNLQNNVNIRSINLHQNFISKIENLDNQLKLEIFICSMNKLEDLPGTVNYLSIFVKLASVAFDGNPIAKAENYDKFIIGGLPNLLSLDYYKINRQLKEESIQFFKSIQSSQEDLNLKIETRSKRRASVIEAENELEQLYDKAFVKGFTEDVIWYKLYQDDAYGKFILENIPDLNDVVLTFQELFKRRTHDLYLKSMEAYTKRQNEFKAFDVEIFKAKSKVLQQCRRLTEEFTEFADTRIITMYRTIDDMTKNEKSPNNEIVQSKLNSMVLEYLEKLENIWYEVMGHEMDLHEKIEEVGEKLFLSLTHIIEARIQEFRVDVGAIREIQHEYNQQLLPVILNLGEFKLNLENSEIQASPESTEKEFLLSALVNSHDHHLSVLDDLEQNRIKDALNWLEKATSDIKSKELDRNTARLFEVNHFVNYYYDQVSDLRIQSRLSVHIPSLWTTKPRIDDK